MNAKGKMLIFLWFWLGAWTDSLQGQAVHQEALGAFPIPKMSLPEELARHGIRQHPDIGLSYTQAKACIKSRLQQLLAEEQGVTAENTFTDLLVNTLIPYWYGTPWSFEGHTATPRTGEIACGYFVSTTLLHLGLKVNRYRLAQQSPIHEAKSLAIDLEKVLSIAAEPAEAIAAIKKGTKTGIYFIGFDASHVGFLLNQAGHLYLIHSNYLDAQGVVIERIAESAVFASYDRFYLVPLSANPRLVQKWLNAENLTVITE